MTQETLFPYFIQKIWRSLELSDPDEATFCQIIVQEIGQWLNLAQVIIYKFSDDNEARIAAESLLETNLSSLQGLYFREEDRMILLPNHFLMEGKSWVLDIENKKAWGQDLSQINEDQTVLETAIMEVKQVEYYQALGIKQCVMMPIFSLQKSLWGALVINHDQSFKINSEQLQILEYLGQQITQIIDKLCLIKQQNQQEEKAHIIQKVFNLLHSQTQIKLQTALTEIGQFFQCNGGLFICF